MSNKVTKSESLAFKKDKETVKPYSNGEVTVYWRPELCIHSANCIIGLPEVFNTKKKPWVNIHGSDSKSIIRAVDSCPSRALTYSKSNKFVTTNVSSKDRKKSKYARVQILNGGPALITGNFILRDIHKKKIKIENEVAAICRCGGSKKKPFCDGSHLSIGFKD